MTKIFAIAGDWGSRIVNVITRRRELSPAEQRRKDRRKRRHQTRQECRNLERGGRVGEDWWNE